MIDAVDHERRNLGIQLAEFRKGRGETQVTLSRKTGYGRSTIAMAERGHPEGRDFWIACDQVLGTGNKLTEGYDRVQEIRRRELDRRAAAASAEHHSQVAVLGPQPAKADARKPSPIDKDAQSLRWTQSQEGEIDHVRRREFLALTGVTITTLDILRGRSPGGIAGGPEPGQESGRVDAETYEGLANLMLGYRQVYRAASAASLLAPVRGTLNLLTELAPDSGRYREKMTSLIGQAATLAGAILMFDLDDFTSARHHLAIGVKAAQQASDDELLAIALACRAFHATYSGDIQSGTTFAEGALDVATRGIHPRSHGWVAAVASEMHATLGPRGETACMRALETASEQLARPMPDQPWSGIGAFDGGKLVAYRGGDLMRLGKYADAQVQLQAALERLSPALPKHRCTAHIDLAQAFAHDNEPEQAAGHATKALEIISSTRHADSLRRVEEIYAAVKASGTAQVRYLGSLLLELKASS